MKIARRSLFQGVCASLLGRALPEPIAEALAARADGVRRRVSARITAIRERVFQPQDDGLDNG